MSSSYPPAAGPAGPAGPAGASGDRKRWWLLGGALACAVLLLITAVIVAGAVWFFALRSSPEDTAQTYFDAYANQDCAAFEESTTESFRDGEEDYSCENWLATLQENPVTYEEEIEDVVVDGDEASVRVAERLHDSGETYEGVYDLEMIKEGGRWLIDSTTTVEEYEQV